MLAVSTSLRMALMAIGQQADVDSVAPKTPRVSAALEDVRRQYPPNRLGSAAMDPSFIEAVVEHSDAFPWGAGHGTLRWTRASEQAGKALHSQGHQCAHVM